MSDKLDGIGLACLMPIHNDIVMKVKEIEFIRAKIDLFSAIANNQIGGERLRAVFLTPLEEMVRTGHWSATKAKDADYGLEKFISTLPHDMHSELRAALRERFGFDQIGKDPETVVRRILKRGRIANDTEAEVARDYVSNLSNEEQVGAEAFQRLAAILDQAGY